jgi:AcrR family transcriptional regulator
MSEEEKSTEKLILDAARKVFLEKGFDGARMQNIADEAGINKALVHYYFRSKEKLFDAIFLEVFSGFFPKVSEIMFSDIVFEKKIELFVDKYIDMLTANPFLPIFMLHEMHRNPEKVVQLMKKTGLNPGKYIGQLAVNIPGQSETIDMRHFIVNLLGLCVFPFVARPIITGMLFNNDDKEMAKFLSQRKAIVTEVLIKSIKAT